MLLHWLEPLVPYRIRCMVVPKGKLKTIKQGTLPSLFSICLNGLSKRAMHCSPISIFHMVLLSLVPRAEDKSTYSNVRREGWWLTNSTATDPFSSLQLSHYSGKGTKQGVKEAACWMRWVYRSWSQEYSALGIWWPRGKYIQRLNNWGPKGPNAINLTLHFPNENIQGS